MKTLEVIDFFLEHFTSDEFSEEVQTARQEFNEMTGGPFDQSADDFEMKMSQFADWYLFVRPLADGSVSPIFSELASGLAEKKSCLEQLEGLRESRSSLFEFLKVKNEDVYLKDLIANEKIVVPSSQVNMGFQRDEYFQARVFLEDEAYHFSPAFCFHPSQATRFILKEVKRVRKLKDASEKAEEKKQFLLKVFKMKYKLSQYKHVDVKDIYSAEPKLRF